MYRNLWFKVLGTSLYTSLIPVSSSSSNSTTTQMEPPAKFSRTDPRTVKIVLRNTSAQVESLPNGFERVLPEDKDHVLQVMVRFHAALEPNNESKQWAVSTEYDSNGTIYYLASFTGYAGLVKTSVLSDFERANVSSGVQTFADLKFTSADRKNTGAITLEIQSKSAATSSSAAGASLISTAGVGRSLTAHHVPESPLAVPFVAAGDGNPANATAEIQVSGAVAQPTGNNRDGTASSSASRRHEPQEGKRKGFLSTLLSSRLLGLGDGGGGEASGAED